MNVDFNLCFIYYEKALDKVKHQCLLEIIQQKGIDPNDTLIIKNLFWNQTAVISFDRHNTEEIVIQKGVRKGYILSTLLFIIYLKKLLRGTQVG